MSKELELNIGTRYVRTLQDTSLAETHADKPQSVIVLSFFAPYIAAEVPCAYFVRKAGLRWSLPGITLAWGFVMLVSLFVTVHTSIISDC